jgi:hypothetical protein
MKLSVRLGTDTVMTLVDSGSMHSFISTKVVCRLHLELVFRPGHQVTVANDDKVASAGVWHNVQFFIDTEAFVMDFFLIPLAGYEMVLRVQLLQTLGPILWDFAHTHMSCWCDDHCVDWHGVAAPGASVIVQALASADLMATLLQEFNDVFTIPIGLPPLSRHNHRIHLLSDTRPIAVHPYWYPQLVKDKLERQCCEMLQQGIICHNTSTFLSPAHQETR